MASLNDVTAASAVSFCSSLDADVWRGLGGPNSYESWHFDAVSDDGREALVIAFYDNYPMSPRFFVQGSRNGENGHSRSSQRCPAVSLVYSVGGRPVFDAVSEYGANEFHINEYKLDYSVGDSRMWLAEAEYGKGFSLIIDIRTRRRRRIRAELEWLFVESDLMPASPPFAPALWNFVAPRADVTGKIMLIGRRGRVRKTVHFRGTGYHDHIASENSHYRDLSSRLWGRAHFVDSTVIFERHGGARERNAPGRLFLVRDGQICERSAKCEATGRKRAGLEAVVPGVITFHSEDEIRLGVTPVRTVRATIAEVKMLSEVTLGLRDGRPRKSIGLTEFVDPRRMRRWLSRRRADLRIGRNGRAPWF